MFSSGARAGQVQGAAPVALVDVVQRLHQALAGGGVFFAKVQAQLFGAVRLQVPQHHARFRILEAGSVDVPNDGAGDFSDVRRVAAGFVQRDGAIGTVLRVFFSKWTGANEGHDLARLTVLLAQFLRRAAGEFGDGFDQVFEFRHRVAE